MLRGKRRLLNKAGLTLIEILIVVAILGSLLAVLAQRIAGGRDKANYQQAKLIMGNITQALDMYYQDCGQYPDSLAALESDQGGACKNWGPEAYMKKVPVDPWGTPFEYYVENGNYTIVSLGKDKRQGGDGYGKDISSADE